MVDREVRIGESMRNAEASKQTSSRIIFWLLSGALILGVVWLFVIPALTYD